MIIRNFSDVEPFPLEATGQVGRVMIGPKEGAQTFVMRVFEFIEPGICYGPGTVDWEFEILILNGKGVVLSDGDKEYEVGPMDFVYAAPNEVFGIKATGTDLFRFLCTVPIRGNFFTDYK